MSERLRSLRLSDASHDLVHACGEYRRQHDLHGGGHLSTGQAWDRMRRAEDRLRAALDAEPEPQPTPSDEERAHWWLLIAKALEKERDRLRRNAGLFPQVADDYRNDLHALAHASGLAMWCHGNPKSAPLPDDFALAIARARTEGYAEGAEAMREQAIAWFARCLKWTGDGYEWCPVAADYREDPSELARRDLPIPRPEGDPQ